MIMLYRKTHTKDTQAMQANMLHQIEIDQAARQYDEKQIDKLRHYLQQVDADNELDMIGKGKSVSEWAIDYMERLSNA